MKKNSPVQIYKDEIYEMQMQGQFAEALQRADQARQLFETQAGGTITPANFGRFMTDPVAYAKELFQAKIETPAGLNRAKYLKMVEYPDFAEIARLLTNQYCSTVFIQISPEGKLELTPKALEVIDAKSIYLEAGSVKLRTWEVFNQYIDVVNLLFELTGSFADFADIPKLYGMADPVYSEDGQKIISYKPSATKFTGKFSNL